MRQVFKDNKEVIKASIDQTISELIDMKDALEMGQKLDSEKDKALLRTIEAYEELRVKFREDDLTDYHDSQIMVILRHRLKVFEIKQKKLQKATVAMKELIEAVDNDLTK